MSELTQDTYTREEVEALLAEVDLLRSLISELADHVLCDTDYDSLADIHASLIMDDGYVLTQLKRFLWATIVPRSPYGAFPTFPFEVLSNRKVNWK